MIVITIYFFLLFAQRAHADKISYPVAFEPLANNGGPVVTVRLSDTVSGKFLIDTGTNASGITAAMAAKLKLKPFPAIGSDGFALHMNGFALNVVEVQNLQVGGLIISKCPLVIFEHGEFKGWGDQIDGIIGANFLFNLPLFIDFAKHQIIFWQEGNLTADERKAVGMDTATRLPMTILEDNVSFAVQARINQQLDVALHVDTGGGNTVIFNRLARQLKLKRIDHSAQCPTFGGNMPNSTARLESVRMGDLTVRDMTIIYPDDDKMWPYPTLGLNFLCDYRILIDVPAHSLYLQPYDNVTTKIGDATHTIHYTCIGLSQVPFLPVHLNFGSAHLFAFAPGTAMSCVDPDFAKSEQISFSKADPGSRTNLDAFVADEATLPADVPVKITPFGMIPTDLKDLQSIFPPLVGLIGWNYFRHYVEQIDFSNHTLKMFAPGMSVPQGAQVQKVPLNVHNGRFYVNVEVDHNKMSFRFDTLHDFTTLSDTKNLAALKPKTTAQAITPAGTVGNSYLRFGNLKVGKQEWSAPILLALPSSTAPAENYLGLDFLSRFLVTIDLENQVLYLEPDPNYKSDETRWISTGIGVNQSTDGHLVISQVLRPSSAFDAGLKVGDEILEINGLPIATTPFTQLAAMVKHIEGETITYKIKPTHQDMPRTVTLTIKKLL